MPAPTIRDIALAAADERRRRLEQEAADRRQVIETAGRAAIRAWLGDPDGLELHTCLVDVDQALVVVCDRETRLAHTRDGEILTVTLDDGRVIRRSSALDSPADLADYLDGGR